jgi:hypothetical protein
MIKKTSGSLRTKLSFPDELRFGGLIEGRNSGSGFSPGIYIVGKDRLEVDTYEYARKKLPTTHFL